MYYYCPLMYFIDDNKLDIRLYTDASDCDSNGKGKGGRLGEVVSYSKELEARVNFYVEAVSGYDDTTDCSVR